MNTHGMRWLARVGAAMGLSAFVLGSSGCGISKDEHQRDLDRQKAAFNAEMAKINEAHAGETAQRDKTVAAQKQMIQGLESEVERMGGDLEKVRAALGEQQTELASAQSELAATTAELNQLQKLRAQAEAEAAQYRQLTDRFRAMIDAGELQVTRRKGRILLNLPDAILFPSGQARFKKKGRKALTEVAKVLAEVKGRDFLIAGHTDNVPVKRGGRYRNNWSLSTARAVEVVQLLIKNGVPPEHLAAAGYGEHDPIADNGTREGRQTNRRLEIILMPKIGDLGA